MKKRRLLIVGCGDVVRRALPILTQRWRVTALVREIDPVLTALGVRQILGDLDQPATLRRLAGIAQAILHSAPPPAQPRPPQDRNQGRNEGRNQGQDTGDPRTRRLLAALARRPSLSCPSPRLVYISTSGVYGDCAGHRVAETRACRPTTARARRRVDAEKLLRRARLNSIILRAPGIYASDRLPLERLKRGDPVLRPAEDVFTNHIHAEDLAAACVAALFRGRPGRTYNIADDSALRMGEWFDKLAVAFNLPHPPRVGRDEAKARLSAPMYSFMTESRQLDNTRMKRELKLRLRYPTVDDGILAALQQGVSPWPCSG